MLSITIPVLSERDLLEAAVPKVIEAAEKLMMPFEIIIASDGDVCKASAQMFSMADERIVHCHSPVRRGKGGAILDALSVAKGEFFCFFDVDLSTDLKHLSEMADALKSGYDIVIGSRTKALSAVQRSRGRAAASRVYISYVRRKLNLKYSDFQCGFKGFKTPVLKSIAAETVERGWAWDTEVLTLAQQYRYQILELPVIWKQGPQSNVKAADVFRMAQAVKRIRKRLINAGKI
ncbi:MAG TPA: glycosyltransferase [Methanocorpusculum sp.]|nr:glycosyltransferase [Methanocorpusculum sp.]